MRSVDDYTLHSIIITIEFSPCCFFVIWYTIDPNASVCVCVDEVMAFRRTLIYVADALRHQAAAAAAAADSSECKSQRQSSIISTC